MPSSEILTDFFSEKNQNITGYNKGHFNYLFNQLTGILIKQ